MTVTINAQITFDAASTHPDAPGAKEIVFSDTYHFDTNYFEDRYAMIEYVKEDLMLVAGGGYETKHVLNPRFKLA